MKKILLVRHGKAVKDGNETDYARLLSTSGRKNIYSLAENLKKDTSCTIDGFYSSIALRAFESAVIIAEESGFSRDNVQINESLYSQDMEAVLHCIETISERYNNVCIVGHNPLLEKLASYFCGDFVFGLPTASCVMFEFDVEKFVDIKENSGRFIFYKFINDNLDKFGKNIIRSLRDESAQMIDSFFENSKNISPDDLSLKAGKIARKILDSSSVVTVRSIELLRKSLLLTEKKEREKEEREKDKVMRKMAKIEEKMNEKIVKMKNKKEILQRLLEDRNTTEDPSSQGKMS